MIKAIVSNDICDKTWQEIYDAFSRRENVIISYRNGHPILVTSVYKNYDPLFYGVNNLIARSPNDYPHLPDAE